MEYQGPKALEEASKDLALCYNNILSRLEKDAPRIAIAPLGTDVGFPREQAAPIAVQKVVEAIKDNPNKFSLIHLFVKKRSEFQQYKELLEPHKNSNFAG